MALDVVFNLRYPGPETCWSPLLPSADATVLLAASAAWVNAGRRIPAALTGVAGVVAVAGSSGFLARASRGNRAFAA